MQLMSNKCSVSWQDLNLFACNFVRMRFHGPHLCTEAITCNTDAGSMLLFLKNYSFYLNLLKEKELAE